MNHPDIFVILLVLMWAHSIILHWTNKINAFLQFIVINAVVSIVSQCSLAHSNWSMNQIKFNEITKKTLLNSFMNHRYHQPCSVAKYFFIDIIFSWCIIICHTKEYPFQNVQQHLSNSSKRSMFMFINKTIFMWNA